MHKCTEADLARFDPPAEESKAKVDLFIKSRSFYCFDLPEQL